MLGHPGRTRKTNVDTHTNPDPSSVLCLTIATHHHTLLVWANLSQTLNQANNQKFFYKAVCYEGIISYGKQHRESLSKVYLPDPSVMFYIHKEYKFRKQYNGNKFNSPKPW